MCPRTRTHGGGRRRGGRAREPWLGKYGPAYGGTVEKLADVSGRLGSIVLYELADPVAVLAVAKGAISLRMIRREIELVAQFADQHPEGWCYLADVRGVRVL